MSLKKKGQEAILIHKDEIMSSFPVRLLADSLLADLSSCFLRLGFVQSSVGRPHTFQMNNNTSVPLYERLENF